MSLLIQIYKKIYWSGSSLLKFGPRIIPKSAKRTIKPDPTAAAEGLKPPIANEANKFMIKKKFLAIIQNFRGNIPNIYRKEII